MYYGYAYIKTIIDIHYCIVGKYVYSIMDINIFSYGSPSAAAAAAASAHCRLLTYYSRI